jgi:hypothetical protein
MRGAASVAIGVLFAVAVGCAADDDTDRSSADNGAGAAVGEGAGGGETAEPAAPLTATLQRSTLFEPTVPCA